MDRWTFYTGAGTCALATHIALHEAGADFALIKLDFASQQQRSDDYLRVNPKGRVPALATAQGVLTETPALLVFVAQQFPDRNLAPLDDAFAFARMQELNSYLASTMHVAHAHKRRGARWVDTDDAAAIEAMQKKVPQTMRACAEHVEHGLTGPWALGERYSVADPYLYTIASWLEADGVDTSTLPRLLAHRARMNARPAVQRALAEGGG